MTEVPRNRRANLLEAEPPASEGEESREAEDILGQLARVFGQFPATAAGIEFPPAESTTRIRLSEAASGPPLAADMSDEAHTEEMRRRAEVRFRTLVEQIPAVTFMVSLDEEENEIYIGPQIESLLGFTQKEWLEDPILWFRQMHPDDHERWIAEFTRGCASGGPFRADCRFLSRDGRTVWVHGEARVVRNDDGRPLFVQGVAFDISDIKEAERALREAHEIVIKTEKLAAVGQLAASVAHELRNPLTSVRNAWFYIEKKLKDSPLAQNDRHIAEFGHIIAAELARCSKIIGDLLDFSRERPLFRTATSVRTFVHSALGVVVKPAAGIEMSNDIPDDLPIVNVDADQFRQVIINLVQNAVEAVSPTTGWVKLRAFPEANAVRIEISDNGKGISPEVQARMFEPLYTTKLRGTGLGLAIVQGVVSRHGGTVSVRSEPNRGTTFSLLVPIERPSSQPPPDFGGAADPRNEPSIGSRDGSPSGEDD